MEPSEFDALKINGYSCIPLVREVLADLDTPLSAYLKLADQPYTYLFESVQGGELWGRYSFIGLSCSERIKIFGNKITHEQENNVTEEFESDDPLAWIQEFIKQFHVPDIPQLPRFTGGVVGYFGYETVHYIEPRLAGEPKPDVLQTPDIFLMVSKELVVFDNLTGKIYLIVHVDPKDEHAFENGEIRLDELVTHLQKSVPTLPKVCSNALSINFVTEFKEDRFKHAVQRARERPAKGS